MSNPPSPVQFIKKLVPNLYIEKGNSITLETQVNNPSANVSWWAEDEELFGIVGHHGRFSIIINNINENIKIICKAEINKSSTQTHSFIHIKVHRAPEFVEGLRGCLWDNGTLSLECDVMGDPVPQLRWYRNGEELLPGGSLKIKANSKERKCYLGLFACEAENCMGTKAIFSKVYAIQFGQFIKLIKKDKNYFGGGGGGGSGGMGNID